VCHKSHLARHRHRREIGNIATFVERQGRLQAELADAVASVTLDLAF